MLPPASPPSPEQLPTLLSCTDIANRIAQGQRGGCHRTSVWRAIQRLKLEPIHTSGSGFKFYSEEQATALAAELRLANHTAE